jgi:hypothetical protein
MNTFRSQALGLAILAILGIAPIDGANAVVTQFTVVHCSDNRGCPDLGAGVTQPKIQTQTFAATSCAVQEGEISVADVPRKLLRFSSTTPNSGPGALILGDPANGPNMDFYQYALCHQHFHFKDYAEYRLWKPADYATWKSRRGDLQWKDIPSSLLIRGLAADGVTALPVGALNFVAGHKQGFCAVDVTKLPQSPKSDPRTYYACGTLTTPGNQGISVGWQDEYVFSLDGQWIDVTNVPSGTYVLEVESNPGRLIEETNYLNDSGTIMVKIP